MKNGVRIDPARSPPPGGRDITCKMYRVNFEHYGIQYIGRDILKPICAVCARERYVYILAGAKSGERSNSRHRSLFKSLDRITSAARNPFILRLGCLADTAMPLHARRVSWLAGSRKWRFRLSAHANADVAIDARSRRFISLALPF